MKEIINNQKRVLKEIIKDSENIREYKKIIKIAEQLNVPDNILFCSHHTEIFPAFFYEEKHLVASLRFGKYMLYCAAAGEGSVRIMEKGKEIFVYTNGKEPRYIKEKYKHGEINKEREIITDNSYFSFMIEDKENKEMKEISRKFIQEVITPDDLKEIMIDTLIDKVLM